MTARDPLQSCSEYLFTQSIIPILISLLFSGEPLSQRPDDHPNTVTKRLQSYQSLTTPLLDYYDSLKVLKRFKGTESDVIWPIVHNYIQTNYSS